MFENLIEFHSLALPETYLIYELPLEERLISFADALDEKDVEESRAFYLIIEKEGKWWSAEGSDDPRQDSERIGTAARRNVQLR